MLDIEGYRLFRVSLDDRPHRRISTAFGHGRNEVDWSRTRIERGNGGPAEASWTRQERQEEGDEARGHQAASAHATPGACAWQFKTVETLVGHGDIRMSVAAACSCQLGSFAACSSSQVEHGNRRRGVNDVVLKSTKLVPTAAPPLREQQSKNETTGRPSREPGGAIAPKRVRGHSNLNQRISLRPVSIAVIAFRTMVIGGPRSLISTS